jgi:hypothetical protein
MNNDGVDLGVVGHKLRIIVLRGRRGEGLTFAVWSIWTYNVSCAGTTTGSGHYRARQLRFRYAGRACDRRGTDII